MAEFRIVHGHLVSEGDTVNHMNDELEIPFPECEYFVLHFDGDNVVLQEDSDEQYIVVVPVMNIYPVGLRPRMHNA